MATRGPDLKARALAKQIVRAASADLATHREYIEHAQHLVAMDLPSLTLGTIDSQIRFEMRRSIVFRRSYLVGWVPANVLTSLAPNCDAIAVPSLLPFGELTPFVLAPSARRRNVSDHFCSVLEHEFVHLNQLLSDVVVPNYESQSASTIVDAFFQHQRIEHEAYLVQSVRWPKVAPPPEPLSFNMWCLLRSHTQALERALERVRSNAALKALLTGVPSSADARLKALGYRAEDVTWFQHRWPRNVVTAATRVLHRIPDAIAGRDALVAWLKRKDVAANLRTQPE